MSERVSTESTRSGLGHFLRDRRGVAAVEFAVLLPVLLCMYFLTMEAGQAIETDKKVGRVGSMVADLVTQRQASIAMTRSDLIAMMRIGTAIMQPYNRSTPKVVVTAISMSNDASPVATVAWSGELADDKYTASPKKPGQLETVPKQLLTPQGFLIRVEATLDYKPVISWSNAKQGSLGFLGAFDTISMGETYYLRPRQANAIACSDC